MTRPPKLRKWVKARIVNHNENYNAATNSCFNIIGNLTNTASTEFLIISFLNSKQYCCITAWRDGGTAPGLEDDDDRSTGNPESSSWRYLGR